MAESPSYKTRRCKSVKPVKPTQISGFKKTIWSVREMRALADGLEKYGFGNVSKLAEAVGTRSENEVKHFMLKWSDRVFKKNATSNQNPLYKLFSKKHSNNFKDIRGFPPIALWRKVVMNLIQPRFKGNNYSNIFAELFRSFAKEEEPYQYEGFPNFKEVYEYLADTLEGNIPPVPSPMTNVILNYLYTDMKQLINKKNFSMEREFFQNFKGPHKFVPSNDIKPEDLKILQQLLNDSVEGDNAKDDDGCKMEEPDPSSASYSSQASGIDDLFEDGPSGSSDSKKLEDQADASNSGFSVADGQVLDDNKDDLVSLDFLMKEHPKDVDYIPRGETIEVPAHLYHLYKFHQKIQESINPMIIPVWMQEHEQRMINEYYKEIDSVERS